MTESYGLNTQEFLINHYSENRERTYEAMKMGVTSEGSNIECKAEVISFIIEEVKFDFIYYLCILNEKDFQ